MFILVFLVTISKIIILVASNSNTISILDSIQANEIALVQFDSRMMDSYWLASANWNKYYCDHHGHKFFYYQAPKGKCYHSGIPKAPTKNELNSNEDRTRLADPWCKVKTMQQVTQDHPEIKLFIYMDSDAVVDNEYYETSVLEFVKEVMIKKIDWNIEEKPIIFNQDGPSWWCSLITKLGYTMCLNAGTVMWYRDTASSSINTLNKWWDMAMDDYKGNPLRRKFRLSWPWEQDRQMYLYNISSNNIQVTSHPDRVFMPRKPDSRKIDDWCFSHLPGSGCFISHFCANSKSKQILAKKYTNKLKTLKGKTDDALDKTLYTFTIEQLRF